MDLTTRRGFLKAATVTTAAAVATGSGAAILLKELGTVQPVATPLVAFAEDAAPVANAIQSSIPQTAITKVGTTQNAPINTQMATDFANALSENVSLQSELGNAAQRIADLERALADSETTQTTLRNDLTGANERVGILAGAVALYEQMDEVDINGIVSRGMSQVSETISDVVDDIPSVSEGLQAGRNALLQFDSEIPLMDGARMWLLLHITRISVLFHNVESMVAIAADNTGTVVELIGEWIGKVLKWLPFNLGEKTANLVQSIADLLDATPDTANTAQQKVLQPLELWFGRADTTDVPLRDRVVAPIRDNSFAKAEAHLGKTGNLRGEYRAKLADPTNLALEQRARIQESIRAYRELHAL
ncbi:MAG: twin-arginine translocation signal domain-containing protein [Candidatus Promineifilaceae bacterium]